jgi:hypothetical protein
VKAKEGIGIGIGIFFLIAAIFSFGLLSKDDQKGRTEPVLQFSWEQANFENPTVDKTLKDLQVQEIKGFLFQKDSQTPLYYAIYLGKSMKGKDAVKAYFKNGKAYPEGLMKREESSLKLAGVATPAICSGARVKDTAEINFYEDFVIISFDAQATNVKLDELQKQHFIHRYFKKRVQEQKKK